MEIFFEEKQKFKQKWLWGLLIFLMVLVEGFFIWGIVQQIGMGKPWGSPGKEISDQGLIFLYVVITSVLSLLMALFINASLKTKVLPSGISVQFFPFHLKEIFISKEKIASWEVRDYHPIKEFGGWGIKWGGKGKKAYSVMGNQGLFIHFKDGKTLMIGTQRPEELKSGMEKIFH